MTRIPPVDPKSSSPQAAAALELIDAAWESEWRLARVLANSPNLLTAFAAYWQGIQTSSLERDEREVVAMEMARRNGCHYCVPAHTMLSREAGIPDPEIARIFDGEAAENSRHCLIQRATQRLAESTGKLTDEELADFRDGGLSDENLLDIIGEIAHCTISNFTNRLAQTEPDDFLKAVEPARKAVDNE